MTVSAWRSLVAALLFVMLSSMAAAAQERGPLAPLDTSSPRATLQSFLEETRALEALYTDYRSAKSTRKAQALLAQLDRLRRLFDLSAVPPALRIKVSGASITALMDILARLPAIDLETVPGGPEFNPPDGPEFWTIPGTEIILARVPEGPRKGTYLFSADTVARLAEFHRRIIGLPLVQPTSYRSWMAEQANFTGPWIPNSVVDGVPDLLRPTLLGTPRWKVLTAIIGLALVIWVNLLWGRAVRHVAAGVSTVPALALRLTKPVLLAASFWLFHMALNLQVNIQGLFAEGEFVLHAIVLYAASAWAVWLLAFLVAEWIIASPWVAEETYDAHLLRLLGRVGALLGSGAIIVYGANDIGIPALGLVAGLGLGGAALALAAKSTVENLFGGVSLFADRPFRVGDYIIYGSSSGTVEAIGPRSSRIRGLDGTVTTVPNADLAAMHVTNFSNRNKCFFHHVIGLRYETSRDQFAWLLPELRRRFAAHPLVEETGGFPRVRMVGFGASSIDVDVRAYVMTTNYAEFLEVQEQLILEIMKIVEEAGTGFAFPSQTTYLAWDDGLDPARVREVGMRARHQTPTPGHAATVSDEGPEADEAAER